MRIDIHETLQLLTHLQRRMGVVSEPELPTAVLDKLRTVGIDVYDHEVRTTPEKVLVWRGEVVVHYIRDQLNWSSGATGYRFHVADCGTRESMRSLGRDHRYVVTNRADGLFPVRVSGRLTYDALQVCRNCLSRLNWDDYRRAGPRERDRIVNGFNVRDFFDTYKNAAKPVAPRAKPQPKLHVPPPEKPRSGSGRRSAPPSTAETGPPESGAGPVTPSSSPATEERWAWDSIEDAQFRAVAFHLQRFGTLTQDELIGMVDGPRRARRFDNSLEEWFRQAPFRVEVRIAGGVKTYLRVMD